MVFILNFFFNYSNIKIGNWYEIVFVNKLFIDLDNLFYFISDYILFIFF